MAIARCIIGVVLGVALGFLLSLVLTYSHAEDRVIDGVPQRVVVFAVNTPTAREGAFELPADWLPHRVVGKIDAAHQEAVCDVAEHVGRMGLVFSIVGVVLGLAVAMGANVFRSVGSGLVAGALTYGLVHWMPIPRAVEHALEFWAMLFGLLVASGEAIYELVATRRKSGPDAA